MVISLLSLMILLACIDTLETTNPMMQNAILKARIALPPDSLVTATSPNLLHCGPNRSTHRIHLRDAPHCISIARNLLSIITLHEYSGQSIQAFTRTSVEDAWALYQMSRLWAVMNRWKDTPNFASVKGCPWASLLEVVRLKASEDYRRSLTDDQCGRIALLLVKMTSDVLLRSCFEDLGQYLESTLLFTVVDILRISEKVVRVKIATNDRLIPLLRKLVVAKHQLAAMGHDLQVILEEISAIC
jgi:hypothetical protein